MHELWLDIRLLVARHPSGSLKRNTETPGPPQGGLVYFCLLPCPRITCKPILTGTEPFEQVYDKHTVY